MGTLQTTSRVLHDLGGAVWLGGSLMGAVGLNGASAHVSDPAERIGVATAGWARWAPVSAAAMGAHLLGGLGVLLANRDRAAAQDDVRTNTIAKAALTVAATGATAWAGVLGAKLAKDGDVPATTGVVPSGETPADVASAQQQLRALQWTIPSLVGVVMGLSAQQGEQQAAYAFSPAAQATTGLRKLARKAPLPR